MSVYGRNDTIYVDDINANPDFFYYRDMYAVCIVGILLTSLIRGLVIMFTTINASTKLHNMFLHKIIDSPLKFFEVTPSGRIQNVFSRDIDESKLFQVLYIYNVYANHRMSSNLIDFYLQLIIIYPYQ